LSLQRQVLPLSKALVVVELRSEGNRYNGSTVGFWSWESPQVEARIFWRQLCFSMLLSEEKTTFEKTEADRRKHMEQIEFTYPAKRKVPKRAYVGVVGSGDMEVLLEPADDLVAHVFVRTSVDGFGASWKAVLDRFFANYDGAARIEINDSGETPGIVQLRLEQAVEASEQ